MTNEEAVHYLKNNPCVCPMGDNIKDCKDHDCSFYKAVNALEEPKTAIMTLGTEHKLFMCSNCETYFFTINKKWEYCPYCGAKFDKTRGNWQ